jgi:predicted porin
MRKLLYTTTALVGAAFLMQAAPASAEVNLAARYNAKFVSSGDADSSNARVKDDLRSFQFSDGARVDFSASKDHPNGLTTGFFSRMTMDGDKDVAAFDDVAGSIAGAFGTVTIGSTGDAGSNVHVGGTPGTTHFGVGEDTIFGAVTGELKLAGAGIGTSATSSVIGRNQSIRYNSPSFTGFSFAFSYAPEVNGNKAGDNFDDDGDHNDGYSIGLAYTNEFGGTSISLSGAFAATDVNAADWKLAEKKVTTVAIPAGDAASTEDVGSRSYVDHAQFARIEVTGSQASIGTTAGDAKDARIGSIIELVRGNTLTAPAASADDSDALTTGYLRPGSTTVGQRGVTTLSKETDEKGNAFSFGAKVGYQDFSFGASYGQYEKGKVEATSWRLGGDYKVDAFTFGLGYGYKEIDEGGYLLAVTAVGDNDNAGDFTGLTEGGVVYGKDAAKHEETTHLAFTVDYALGDGANIDFGISNYKTEKTAWMYNDKGRFEGFYTRDTTKASGTGFGVGVTLSF